MIEVTLEYAVIVFVERKHVMVGESVRGKREEDGEQILDNFNSNCANGISVEVKEYNLYVNA